MLATTIRTDELPVHQRLRFLRASMQALSFDCRIEPTGGMPISTRMTAHIAESFRVVQVAFSAHRTEHAVPSRLRRPADTFLISLHQKGNVVVAQDGRTAEIGPQELFVIDTARPFTIDAGQMRCLSLYVPGARLRSVVPDLDRFTATPISAQHGTGALFAATLEQIYRNVGDIDDAGARRVADALPHLVGAMCASQTNASAFVTQTTEEAQFARITGFALDHLGDPDLSTRIVAAGVALSVRRVHQVFERRSASLMKWVWNERLLRAHHELTAPARRACSIAEIAYSLGFSDPAHFSRAFAKRFGHSPRTHRSQTGFATPE